MNLTMSLIKADIVAAKQAIDYYENSIQKQIIWIIQTFIHTI